MNTFLLGERGFGTITADYIYLAFQSPALSMEVGGKEQDPPTQYLSKKIIDQDQSCPS
jgi:hypothetical protein